jgi:hypothetical protein
MLTPGLTPLGCAYSGPLGLDHSPFETVKTKTATLIVMRDGKPGSVPLLP